jgi:beta-glucosidase
MRLLAGLAACVVIAGASPAAAADIAADPAVIDARVEALLARMSITERIRLIAGDAMMSVPGLPALGIPSLHMSDGPMGTRIPNPSTAYAAGIGLAATWDPALAHDVGVQLGRDARSRGAHFLLGPGVNLYRTPLNGRNFEYFGEDPFLASRIAVGYIEGVQSEHVSATVKHYVGNNAEFARQTSDSVIDDRTLREIYLPVFEAAVKEAHVGAVMTAYNRTNGEHMSQNAWLDAQVLKRDWGFDGVLMSDWGSTYDTVAAANAGLDLEMPSGAVFNAGALLPALASGAVAPGVLDDKVRRVLRLAVRFGWLDHTQLDLDVPRYNEAGRAASLRGATEGMVLLRNERQLLPLDRGAVHTIALLGPDAFPAIPTAGGSGMVETYGAVSPLTALSDYLGGDGRVLYERGVRTLSQIVHATPFTTSADGRVRGVTVEAFANDHLAGSPAAVRVLRIFSVRPPPGDPDADEPDDPGIADRADAAVAAEPVSPDTVLSGATTATSMRITGYFTPRAPGRYVAALHTSNRFRLIVDDRPVLDDAVILRGTRRYAQVTLDARPHRVVVEQFHPPVRQAPDDFLQVGLVRADALVSPTALAMAARAEVAIVAVGFDPTTEGEGFDREFALPPDQQALIEQVAAVNPRTIVVVTSGGSVDAAPWLDRTAALIEGWYGGEEGGTALARLLFGESDFSGRLPISWERQLTDNPSYAHYYFDDPETQRIRYGEGIFTGYRGYERNHVQPLFPFGFGLSYTTFRYDHLELRPLPGAAARFDVSFDITNTGTRAGADVAQVYVGDATHPAVDRPIKELKGFVRQELQPGETRRARLTLDARAFTYFDVKGHAWRASAGTYRVLVGRSSADIVLTGALQLNPSIVLPVGR